MADEPKSREEIEAEVARLFANYNRPMVEGLSAKQFCEFTEAPKADLNAANERYRFINIYNQCPAWVFPLITGLLAIAWILTDRKWILIPLVIMIWVGGHHTGIFYGFSDGYRWGFSKGIIRVLGIPDNRSEAIATNALLADEIGFYKELIDKSKPDKPEDKD
jgi:hypothetical protein